MVGEDIVDHNHCARRRASLDIHEVAKGVFEQMQPVNKAEIRQQILRSFSEEVVACERDDRGGWRQLAFDRGRWVDTCRGTACESQTPSVANADFEVMDGAKFAVQAVENIEI
jgi:hypothetical protein